MHLDQEFPKFSAPALNNRSFYPMVIRICVQQSLYPQMVDAMVSLPIRGFMQLQEQGVREVTVGKFINMFSTVNYRFAMGRGKTLGHAKDSDEEKEFFIDLCKLCFFVAGGLGFKFVPETKTVLLPTFPEDMVKWYNDEKEEAKELMTEYFELAGKDVDEPVASSFHSVLGAILR